MEVNTFCHYLLGADCPNRIARLYDHIIKLDSSGSDRAVDLATNHPRLLPFLDSGLALMRPQAELRRRLFITFALLESSPEFSDKFLTQDRSPFYAIIVGLLGLRSIFRAFVGVIIVKVTRL